MGCAYATRVWQPDVMTINSGTNSKPGHDTHSRWRWTSALLGLLSASAQALNVTAVPVAEIELSDRDSAPATVVARNEPLLAAEIAARVLGISVDVGDRVEAGQLLATLDCRAYDAALGAAGATVERSRAQRRFAEQQLDRARDLRKKKSISEELLDQRTSELAAANADLASARQQVVAAEIDVDHCTIVSPFEGVVTTRPASVGSYVNRGTPVIGLIEIEGREVSADLRREQIAGFDSAQSLNFVVGGREFPLTLRALLPIVDTVARTREVRLRFMDARAPIGSAGRLVWTGAMRLLQADLLVRRDGRLGVFVVDDGSARFIALEQAQDGRAAAHDLPADTLVIVQGRQRLTDGEKLDSVTTEAQ